MFLIISITVPASSPPNPSLHICTDSMSSVAGKDKPMDVVEDELELDVKDELQPILASAAEINTEFKDEFRKKKRTKILLYFL